MPAQQQTQANKGQGKGRHMKYSDSEDGKEQIPYEVYESAANTYFNNREYNKAINSYTKVIYIYIYIYIIIPLS